MWLTIFISTMMYSFFIMLGRLLLFVDEFAFWTILIFVISVSILQFGYTKGTCKVMEYRDFIYTALLVGVVYIISLMIQTPITVDMLFYYYLIAFLSISSFASSLRFKSLL